MSTKYDENRWNEWLSSQPEDVKSLVAERFQSLENSVKAARSERDGFKQSSDTLSKKASFFEGAYDQHCVRPAAAYAVAVSEGHWTHDGSPDWAKIQSAVPELFKANGAVNAGSKAGAGTGSRPQSQVTVSDAIRTALRK